MFFRMIWGTLGRQWKKMILIAFTIMLGSSLATAMLSVMMDVGDKINEELRAYGANITVVPQANSVVNELYDIESGNTSGVHLNEEELPKIKTIFWTYNIVDYAPFLDVALTLDDGSTITAVGTWFNHHLELSTGESVDSGVASLRSWWDITSGDWADEQAQDGISICMVGATLAEKLGIAVGDTLHVKGSAGSAELKVMGIYSSGDEDDERIYAPLDALQPLADLEGAIDSIEVSALTTPDNELSEAAAKDPNSLSKDQMETWYCTAYPSSICFQIQEVITGSVASPVRQVADSEGEILDKTQLLMVLITILALVGSALGIMNLVTASVIERRQEIGLMKAVGAQNRAIVALIITEILITAILGGVVGYFVGFGLAQVIGQTVFAASITMRSMTIPVVAVLVILVALVGSVPAIRATVRMDPAEVLHDR